MTPRFVDLFVWEWRQAGRAPLLWTILLVLSASFIWGALNTAWLHRDQTASIAQAMSDLSEKEAADRALARHFREPVSADKGPVAYWQDPTNVAGYSEYFVRRIAAKPHLPASPLAAGVSDLAPSRLEIKLNTPFGFSDTYDFQNPRGLSLGRFDLAFAIVFLAPAALILLCCLLGTAEKDRGMLRLVASQSVGAATWVGTRLLAILAWVLPIAALSLVLALALAGVPLAALAAIAAATVLLSAYLLFWGAVAFLVLAVQPTASAALSLLTAIWAVVTIGAPIAIGAALSIVDPAPSPVRFIDAQRRVTDAVQVDRDAIITRAVARKLELHDLGRPIESLDHATRLSFLVPEIERRLAPLRLAADDHRLRQAQAASMVSLALPSIGVEIALARLAGVDTERHSAFEAQARAYQLRLRSQVHPLVQAQMLLPPQPATRATRGSLSLAEPLALPAFAFKEPSGSSPITNALLYGLWLGVAAPVLALIATRRAKTWRIL